MVAVVDPPPANALRVSLTVGNRRPIHIGATGKVILAAMTDDEVREILGHGPLVAGTPKTLVSLERLLDELAEIRRRKFATNREESVMGSGGVAAPVGIRPEVAPGGLFITFRVQSVPDRKMHALAEQAVDAAQRISSPAGGAIVFVR